MKVIKSGYCSPYPFRVSCSDCRCEYEVESEADVKKTEHENDGTTGYAIVCPECGVEGYITARSAWA